jgi:hypothetical protein
MLLIIGGNDTTRNSISAGVLAMNRWPEQFEKLKADRSKIPNAVAEIIRWQTPLAFMRRTTTEDVEIGGKVIPKGERVLMWYASGNRDESVFENADILDVDRANARQHLSFGYGVHRCMGNRVAELQLNLLWEELLDRYSRIEVVGAPVRAISRARRHADGAHRPGRLLCAGRGAGRTRDDAQRLAGPAGGAILLRPQYRACLGRAPRLALRLRSLFRLRSERWPDAGVRAAGRRRAFTFPGHVPFRRPGHSPRCHDCRFSRSHDQPL